MAELYPLSKAEFETLYDKAWKNGWVYGRFFQELYDEYLVNWVYFVDYLDVLKGVDTDHRMYKRIEEKFVIVIAENQQPILIEAEDHYSKHIKSRTQRKAIKSRTQRKAIEILIGEAPPYWKGNAENKDKSYFYNPNYFEKKGSWITAPLAFKRSKRNLGSTQVEKTYCLSFLAKKRMFLFDVFPFPIIQDTKIRQAVSGKFPEHIEEYFIPKLESIIEYIGEQKENITYGFVATTYGSLHLLFGDKTREIIKNFDNEFYTRGIKSIKSIKLLKIKFIFNGHKTTPRTLQIAGYSIKGKPTVLFKTIYKLICPEVYFEVEFNNITAESFNNNNYVNAINEILQKNKIPILMDGSGNVNFENFFNSIKNPSFLEEEENLKKNQEEEEEEED